MAATKMEENEEFRGHEERGREGEEKSVETETRGTYYLKLFLTHLCYILQTIKHLVCFHFIAQTISAFTFIDYVQ